MIRTIKTMVMVLVGLCGFVFAKDNPADFLSRP